MSTDTSFECQLATHFSCQCPKCMGLDIVVTTSVEATVDINDTKMIESDTNQQQYYDELFQFSSSSVAVVGLQQHEQMEETYSTHDDDAFDQHSNVEDINAEQNSTPEKFSSASSCIVDDEVVVDVPQEQIEEEIQQIPTAEAPQKLTRRQRKALHVKTGLDLARSLRDTKGRFFPSSPPRRSVNDHRMYRRNRRRQYLPIWCYNATARDGVRLPRSTAIAHICKNKWIKRFRICNCKKPFSHVGTSDDATLIKPDSRGKLRSDRFLKFHWEDSRQRFRDNHPKAKMGNSRKSIPGKYWLDNSRSKKLAAGNYDPDELVSWGEDEYW